MNFHLLLTSVKDALAYSSLGIFRPLLVFLFENFSIIVILKFDYVIQIQQFDLIWKHQFNISIVEHFEPCFNSFLCFLQLSSEF